MTRISLKNVNSVPYWKPLAYSFIVVLINEYVLIIITILGLVSNL